VQAAGRPRQPNGASTAAPAGGTTVPGSGTGDAAPVIGRDALMADEGSGETPPSLIDPRDAEEVAPAPPGGVSPAAAPLPPTEDRPADR
jgi:hypothetical protein